MNEPIPDWQELIQAITVGGEPFFYVGVKDVKGLLKRLAEVTADRDRLRAVLDAVLAGSIQAEFGWSQEAEEYRYWFRLYGGKSSIVSYPSRIEALLAALEKLQAVKVAGGGK